jgi:hypothetical protein
MIYGDPRLAYFFADGSPGPSPHQWRRIVVFNQSNICGGDNATGACIYQFGSYRPIYAMDEIGFCVLR